MRRLTLGFGILLSALPLAVGCGDDSTDGNNNNVNDNGNTNGNAVCGNGAVESGEECDDGVDNSDTAPDACRSDCRDPYCGDGVVDPLNNETCDDGGTANNDGCDDQCLVETGWDCSSGTCAEICGDDLAVGDESCDGTDLRLQTCVSLSLAPGELLCDENCEYDTTGCVGGYVCGDGTKDPGEGCDDGNLTNCDGCNSNCQVEECGNNVVECDEVCDDGNNTSGDNCSADCLSTESCGNGYVDTAKGETCDDGGESATCDADCTAATCGDGTLNTTAGEVCDDGNTDDGDSCAGNCQAVTCPNGNTCVEEPPGTWAGPVALYVGPTGNAVPMCPTEYPTNAYDLNDGLQATGSCSCSCGTPQSVTCQSVTLKNYSNSSCQSFAYNVASLAPGVCTSIGLTYANVSFGSPAITGGVCASSTQNNIVTPTWQNSVRMCGGATTTAAGCGTDQVCAPDPSGLYDTQLCIYSAGDVACPSGSTYNQRSVYYGNYQDTRTCSTCTCGSPTGDCGGKITFISSCSGMPILYGSIDADLCSTTDTAAAAATYGPSSTVNGSCAASSGSVNGAATETGPVTVCCQP